MRALDEEQLWRPRPLDVVAISTVPDRRIGTRVRDARVGPYPGGPALSEGVILRRVIGRQPVRWRKLVTYSSVD